MPVEVVKDGDVGFIGLSSRDNPAALKAGMVSESKNFRLDRGIATVRKGLQRKTVGALIGKTVYASGCYLDSSGQEIIVIVHCDGLHTYNPQSEVLSSKFYFPNRVTTATWATSNGSTLTITQATHGLVAGKYVSLAFSNTQYDGLYLIQTANTNTFTVTKTPAGTGTMPQSGSCSYVAEPNLILTSEGVDVVACLDKIFITRGHNLRPFQWDFSSTLTALPTAGAGKEFPNCSGLLYYANRLIAIGHYHDDPMGDGYKYTARSRDSVSVSNYIDPYYWDALDVFSFNQGGNDEVVSVSPWTINEFLVLMRNSIFYVNIGTGRYANSDPLSTGSFTKTLVSDLGCSAKRSVILANGGVIFLSDKGVYFLQPQQVGANDAVRLLTVADPLSSPIDDVIQRINKAAAKNSVACYWNNRYYLAVPLDNSTDNNAVLVYNFILQSWESVDTYPAGFDVANFIVAKKDSQRRMFAIDSTEGIFLTEELDTDEYGSATGSPMLPFILPTTLQSLAFQKNTINATLTTRRYNFGGIMDKRFQKVETEVSCFAGSTIRTTAIVNNPDTADVIDSFGSPEDEDFTRRIPIRKFGAGLQLKYEVMNIRPSIKSAYAYAYINLKNTQSKK